jgi:N-acetyl-anhydromuramyl-L-alanine amidase AmpD
MTILDKITMNPLAPDQYYNEDTVKTQIYVHHTAGGPNPQTAIDWWNSTPERVATAFIIGRDAPANAKWYNGQIVQCYGSGKWAHHLGLKASQLVSGGKTNLELNKGSIGIEICNWGGLTRTANGYATYAGNIIAESDIVEYPTPYKSYKYFQKYTSEQLGNLHELLQFLCNKWNISSAYKGDQIFNVDKRALMGENGIFTHTSVRPDKSDCHPQPELIQVLKSL